MVPSGLGNERVGEKRTRSRAGCLGCRHSRVKCDESHPTCGRCAERQRACEWPTGIVSRDASTPSRKQRNPRPLSSCDSCRVKKIKCDAAIGSICSPCTSRDIVCTWSLASRRRESSLARPTSSPSRSELVPPAATTQSPTNTIDNDLVEEGHIVSVEDFAFPAPISSTVTTSLPTAPSSDPFAPFPQSIAPSFTPPTLGSTLAATGRAAPEVQELNVGSSASSTSRQVRELIRLYFTTVHNFGYLSFIHEGDFWERYEQGRAPETLCQLMAASALRFGKRGPSKEDLALADQWASDAGDKLLGSVFKEFGAVSLMEVVLCHHYDFLAGRYSRGWLMAGLAVRMMTFLRLHILDETSHQSSKPFLSLETLRRLAWSVWFLDATLDGGNFGFSTIGDGTIINQLPSDERPFLLHQEVETEQLIPRDDIGQPSNLALSAHLIRSMHARQILADAHSRIQRDLIPRDSIFDLVRHTSQEARAILENFPRELGYSRSLYHAYRDQHTMLVHLHVMRNTCARHQALLKILAIGHALRSPAGQQSEDADGKSVNDRDSRIRELATQRRTLIQDAALLSDILRDAVAFGVVFDPQIAMHSYNAIEVLLFQPLRQAMERTEVTITRDEVTKCLKPLLEVIRGLATSSELVALIHPEAVNRMIRMGYADDLTNEDIMAVLHKVHSLANADTEFDFNESFWRYELSLARSSNRNPPTDPQFGTLIAESPNERLLETNAELVSERPSGVSAQNSVTSGICFPVYPLPSSSVRISPNVHNTSFLPQRDDDADPLTRLHSFLAINSRRNSFSGFDAQNQSQSDLGTLRGAAGLGYDHDFAFNSGFGLGPGDDLSTLLTNGMRAGLVGLSDGSASTTLDGMAAGSLPDPEWLGDQSKQWS